MLNIQLSFLLSVVSINVILMAIVLFSSNKNRINKIFALTIFTMVGWIVCAYFSQETANNLLSLWLARFAFIFAGYIGLFLLGFSFIFPNDENESLMNYKVWKISFYSSFAITALLLTPLMVKNVEITTWGANVINGKIYQLFGLYFITNIIYSLINLINKYRKKDITQTENRQLFLIFLGFSITAIIATATNFIIPLLTGTNELAKFGPFATIFLVGMTSYAITKNQLFDIKVITTEILVFILGIGALVDTFLSKSLLESALKTGLTLLIALGGYSLIKSIKQEISQKDKIQKLAKDLKEANDNLKQLDKTKDDFLSMASHELNTPIAAIEGYLSMILVEGLGGKIPDKARKYLASVFQSSQRLAHLVKDLLNVSRIESDRIHIIYEECQIIDLINQAIMEIGSKVQEKHHTLIFKQAKAKMPTTWLDKTRITEVLINIIGNSIKYTPEHGTIEVKVVHDDDKLVVSVSDNGKGIPKDRNDAVFQKFTQVDVLKDEVKGTGLGMYISKRFIELHKGKIWFHSDGADKGTTFFFSLPISAKKPYDPFDGEGSVLH